MSAIELSDYTYNEIKELLNPENRTRENNDFVKSLAECFCNTMMSVINETRKQQKGKDAKTTYSITYNKLNKFLQSIQAYDPHNPQLETKSEAINRYKKLFNKPKDKENLIEALNSIRKDKKPLKIYLNNEEKDIPADIEEMRQEGVEIVPVTPEYVKEKLAKSYSSSEAFDIVGEKEQTMAQDAVANSENYLTNIELVDEAQMTEPKEETSEYISDEDYGIPSEEEEMERRLGK